MQSPLQPPPCPLSSHCRARQLGQAQRVTKEAHAVWTWKEYSKQLPKRQTPGDTSNPENEEPASRVRCSGRSHRGRQ